jgi:hypothetical protein
MLLMGFYIGDYMKSTTPPPPPELKEPPKLHHHKTPPPVAPHTYSCARALFRPISRQTDGVVKPPVHTIIGNGMK